MIREAGRRALHGPPGKKVNKETLWQDEEVLGSKEAEND